MGIYIKGIEMPKEGSWKTICIYSDGTCDIPNWQGDCTAIKGAKAIPVPPHGRLKDADALMRSNKNYVYTQTDIDLFPTVIPASEETED